MDLKAKYQQLTDFARQSNTVGLSIEERNNVLYISGSANAATKDKLWEIYNKIDPDMRSGDLVMNIQTDNSIPANEVYVIKSGDSLSKIAAKYPGMTWKKIFEYNKDSIKDPDKIFPGQKIFIPSK